jgi:multidrug efflux system membrane fusion protein
MPVVSNLPDAFDAAVARKSHEERRRPTRGKMIVRFVVMAVLLTIVFGGLYGFDRFRSQKIAEFFANNRPPPTPVAAAEAKAQSLAKFLSGIGTVQAVHQVTVAPEVGGRIVQITFQSGAAVRAGEPLVQLNDRPEQGDLANYRAQARLAAVNLSRNKDLLTRQAAPQATVDQYQSQLDSANANIAKTEAVIAQKLVRAPFDGELGIRLVEVGQYINPGAAIISLTDLSQVYVNFSLPEQTRAQLAVGQAVAITVDAFPGRAFDARITTIEPQIGADTRNIKIQATMANPGRMLQPGMFANVRVALPPEPDVVTVPETAVDYSLYGDSVFLIREDGKGADDKPSLKVARTFVKTGDRVDGRVAILSGLKPGDRVASSGQLRLNDGVAVTLTDTSVLAIPAAVPVN